MIHTLVYGENVTFIAVAIALLAIAVVVFVRGVHDLVLAPPREPFAVTITRAVNAVLFIVIVLELLRTIVASSMEAASSCSPSWSSASPRLPGTS